MPLPVSLKDVADQIDACPQEWCASIDRKTGEIVTFPSEDSWGDKEDFADDIARVESSQDFIPLPTQRDMNEYQIMERFCDTITDDRKRERLEDAISGKGAFGRFKAMIIRLDVREQWFDFKRKAFARETRYFLIDNKIPFIDDAGLEPAPPE